GRRPDPVDRRWRCLRCRDDRQPRLRHRRPVRHRRRPEGVIAAAALKCVGGELQARLRFRNDEERARAKKMGVKPEDTIYAIEDLAKGDVMFAATGVTKGYLLDGVVFFGDRATTES